MRCIGYVCSFIPTTLHHAIKHVSSYECIISKSVTHLAFTNALHIHSQTLITVLDQSKTFVLIKYKVK